MANSSSQHKHVSGSGSNDGNGQEIISPPLHRFTYEIAPIFILMEHVVLKKMREIIGFPDGDSILAPGQILFYPLPQLPVQLVSRSPFSFALSSALLVPVPGFVW
jgi:hypothetical protein